MKQKCVLKEREIQNTQWQSRSVRLRVIHRWGPQVTAAAGSAHSEWAELLSNLLLSGLDYFSRKWAGLFFNILLSGLDYFSKPQESGLDYFLTFYWVGWIIFQNLKKVGWIIVQPSTEWAGLYFKTSRKWAELFSNILLWGLDYFSKWAGFLIKPWRVG